MPLLNLRPSVEKLSALSIKQQYVAYICMFSFFAIFHDSGQYFLCWLANVNPGYLKWTCMVWSTLYLEVTLKSFHIYSNFVYSFDVRVSNHYCNLKKKIVTELLLVNSSWILINIVAY